MNANIVLGGFGGVLIDLDLVLLELGLQATVLDLEFVELLEAQFSLEVAVLPDLDLVLQVADLGFCLFSELDFEHVFFQLGPLLLQLGFEQSQFFGVALAR